MNKPRNRARSKPRKDDFAEEIALTRKSKALMKLLAERSKEEAKHSIADVRSRLDVD